MPPDETSPPAFRPKARRPRVRDRRGALLRAERALVEKVSQVYEKWGFEPLDTAALEYADALGKFLPDQDRPNEGVFAFQDDDEQWLALRYDLTAPLARFVAENFDALPKPYRRWAAGPVWRNEKLGPGRFREFWQCDADTVGSASPAADAEMIAMACEAIEAVGVGKGAYAIKINTRRLLNGVLQSIGVADAEVTRKLTVLRAIDKLDRLGVGGVRALLGPGRKDESGDFTKGADLNADAIDRVLAFVQAGSGSRIDVLARLSNVIANSAEAEAGLAELSQIHQVLNALGIDDARAQFEPAIVRGLEYYTGAVYEIELLGEITDEDGKPARIGSVGAGGRYDDLVARFRGERIPATGISIGVSRLAGALNAQGADEDGPIVILALDADQMADYYALAREVRAKTGHATEVYLGAGRFGAQLKYADKRNSPLAIIIGEDERKAGKVTIKNLVVGARMAKGIASNDEWRKGRPAQITVDRADLVAEVRKELALLQGESAS